MAKKKPLRERDAGHLYLLHRQGWELEYRSQPELEYRLYHTDGRATRWHALVRDAVGEVVTSFDPDILSRRRRRQITDELERQYLQAHHPEPCPR